jgi:hypothetical protein
MRKRNADFHCLGYGQLKSEKKSACPCNINHETLFTPQISVLLLKECPEVNQHPPQKKNLFQSKQTGSPNVKTILVLLHR